MMESTTKNKIVVEGEGYYGDKNYYGGLAGPIEEAIEQATREVFNVNDSVPGASTWDESTKKFRVTIEILSE